MKINLTELLAKFGAEADLEETDQVSYPDDGLVLTQPVKMKLHLLNTGELVLLTGQATTELELECSRCLQKFRQPVTVNLKEEFVQNLPPQQYKKGAEIELHEEDFVSPIGPDNTIDISDVVRQNLLLTLPLSPHCGEKCQA